MQNTKTLVNKILDEKKLSKYRISKRCGVSWATVQYWAKGTFEAKEKNMVVLLEIYNES